MTKTQKYILISTWILFTRSYDAYCTHLFTPDLSEEANILVSFFGMNWGPLLIIVSALTLYTLYTFYISTFKPKSLLPTEKGYTLSNIVAYTYHGQKDEWYSIFYKFPNHLSRFNQYMGHLLTRCVVFGGFLTTIMWLLINYTSWYKEIHNTSILYLILIVGCIFIKYQWSKNQFNKYKAEIKFI